MRSMKKHASALATTFIALSLAITACSSPTAQESGDTKSDNSASASEDPGEKGFDVSKIQADPEIQKLVPDNIKKAGVLINGASTDYAPGEYRKQDGQTPTGYDVDMIRAMAKLMGVEAKTQHIPFESLIPRIGDDVNVGASSFTVTKERMQEKNMVSYFRAGFQFATAKGNPNKFDVKDICGKKIGVQTGTAQQDWLKEESKKCEDAQKPAINIMPSTQQTEITPKVASGQYDATVADSPVAGYYVRKSNGAIELVGDVFDSALHGVVIDKKDSQLTEAVQKALQKMMDDGTLQEIMAHYGVEDGLETKAQLNPDVKD